VTPNNDTPRMFGDTVRRDTAVDTEWRDGAGEDALTGAEPQDGPDDWAEVGLADRAEQAEPYLRWADWEEPAQDEAGDAAYPQPSFYPPGPGYPAGPEYAWVASDTEGSGYPGAPGYPRGPGYAPIPADHPGPAETGYPAEPGYPAEAGYPAETGYPAEAGYPAGPGYVPDRGYRHDLDYPQDSGTGYASGPAPGPEYGRDRGYTRDPGAVPAMEPLPGWALREAGAPPGPAQPGTMPAPADSLTTESLLHGKRHGPGSGWRRGISRMTGGLLRLGESSAEMRRRDLINRVRTPVAGGHHRVAVLSLKGGVGKTTTAVGLGATFATLRGDRVIAVDANPDRGTLSDKVRLETAATIRDLLNERDQVRRYADVRAFTSQTPSRLEVLASDRDPAVSIAFGAEDYCDVAQVLEHFYSICLTDCGTGLLHSAMSGVLRLADQIVVVSSPSVDGARSASATLDWLEAHQCGDLVRNGVVVLSIIRPKSKSTVDLDRLERHFAARCRAVVRIPYDAHLEEGAEVDLELLSAETADAYLTLAAIAGDGLAWPRRMTSRFAFP
jgi:MinD-like ATPase involved in chromosome partitioning or flagellar assembly